MTMMARRPASTRLSSLRSSGAAWMSRADRGSSSSSTSGSTARARAAATRCACPPDNSPGRRSARSAASTSASQCRADSRASRLGIPALRGPKATFSRALRCGNSRGSWASRAVPRRCGAVHVCTPGPSSNRTRPFTSARPVSGRSSPEITESRVDFPAPFGPSTATVSPGARLSDTSKRRAARAASSVNVMPAPARGCRYALICRRTRPAPVHGRRARRRRPPPQRGAGTARRRRRRRSPAAGRFPAAGCG